MIKEAISKVVSRESLNQEEAEQVMLQIMQGHATGAQIGSLLTALRLKGETVEEITGFAKVMREQALSVEGNNANLIDIVGTGGDNSGTFNISTTVAFVVAGAGVPVAKHGNHSISSRSGSADLLNALGVNIKLTHDRAEQILDEIGICFLYAPTFHQAMKHAIGPRKEIGIRSIFNVLGPLTNPARTKNQLVGVYAENLTEVIARVLNSLDVERAFVVHGEGGLDEISTIGQTKVTSLNKGKIDNFYISPEDYGIQRVSLEQIQGGSPEINAQITLSVLEGEKSPYRDIVLLNAAAAFVVSSIAKDISEGLKIAEDSIDSKKALSKLEQLIQASNKEKNYDIR